MKKVVFSLGLAFSLLSLFVGCQSRGAGFYGRNHSSGSSSSGSCSSGSCQAPSYSSAPVYEGSPSVPHLSPSPNYSAPSGSGGRSAPMFQGSGSR